jgi:hypothetical protein
MNLGEVRARAHGVDAELASDASSLRLDRDEQVVGLFAFFAGDRSRRVVRVLIEGQEAGYLERREVLDWFQTRSMGLGDADRAALMGHVPARSWRFRELACPVPGCPEPPQYVVSFAADDPPRCRTHPDRELRPRP